MTIQEVSRRSGLSEPAPRYYEEVGLIGPVDRDTRSGHRRYGDKDVDVLQLLACLRALGMGIEDMRTYQANRGRGGRAAVGYTPKPSADFTEDDWTDPDLPGLPPYPRSKTIAERAAWDFMNSEGGGTELTVVNPTFILGPPLTAETGSSLYLIKAMFSGTMSNDRAKAELGWRPAPAGDDDRGHGREPARPRRPAAVVPGAGSAAPVLTT
jgi:DNA-binding transcriptional MerR regulator